MKKTIQLLVFLSTLLSLSGDSFAMQFACNVSNETKASKQTSRWQQREVEDARKMGFEVTTEFNDLIHPMLKKAGLNPDGIIIMKGDLVIDGCGEAKSSVLLIDSAFILKNPNRAKGMIGHEIMHLKNGDPDHTTKTVPFMQLSLAALCALKAYNREWLSIVSPNALLFGAASAACYSILSPRYQEQRADIQAAQTYSEDNIATHMISNFQEWQQLHLKYRDDLIKEIEQSDSWPILKKIKLWWLDHTFINAKGDYLRDIQHPLYSTRIAYLTKIANQQATEKQMPIKSRL